jgi:tetratricopeptide (TPR) repeat protein
MAHQILAQQAIEAALQGNWQEALLLNLKILKENKNDIQTLNRLAKAYLKIGQKKKSLQIYKKVLRIDKYNPIATKNLTKIKLQKGRIRKEQSENPLPKTIFLEEPGKTKIVNLVNLAPKQVLVGLSSADKVLIKPKKRVVYLCSVDSRYIGSLPDDLSQRLISLIKGGNQYEAFIKSVDKNCVSVFLREIKRAGRFKHLPSFALTSQSQFYSFVNENPFST